MLSGYHWVREHRPYYVRVWLRRVPQRQRYFSQPSACQWVSSPWNRCLLLRQIIAYDVTIKSTTLRTTRRQHRQRERRGTTDSTTGCARVSVSSFKIIHLVQEVFGLTFGIIRKTDSIQRPNCKRARGKKKREKCKYLLWCSPEFSVKAMSYTVYDSTWIISLKRIGVQRLFIIYQASINCN